MKHWSLLWMNTWRMRKVSIVFDEPMATVVKRLAREVEANKRARPVRGRRLMRGWVNADGRFRLLMRRPEFSNSWQRALGGRLVPLGESAELVGEFQMGKLVRFISGFQIFGISIFFILGFVELAQKIQEGDILGIYPLGLIPALALGSWAVATVGAWDSMVNENLLVKRLQAIASTGDRGRPPV